VITCPVCEQQQSNGAECEVCGRALETAGGDQGDGPEAPVEPIEGLETTAQAGQGVVGEVGVIPELEPTLQASTGAVVAEPMAELEATLAAPVDAPGEVVPDLEPTAAAPSGEARTELPLFPVCRYCRTPAGPGEKLCGRCGMQVEPLVAPSPAAAGAGPRLCSCGTPITRSTCPACGARNRTG
jgi:hypothetical protein